MASEQIFAKELVGDLDVTSIFTELMKTSVGKDSIYIRTKETLNALFNEGDFTAKEKSEALAQVLGQVTTSATNTAMQLAFTIAKENQDAPYDLAKKVADTKLAQQQADKLAEDTALTAAELANIEADTKNKTFIGWKTQADIYAQNGVDVTSENITIPLLTSVTPTNKLALMVVEGEQSKAAKYATLASAFRRDGGYSWSTDINSDIVVGAEAVTSWTPLTKAQTDVAIRQEQGFDDNMVQHAANSSANMIGLLLSSENYDALTLADVARWQTAVDYLNTPLAP